MTNEEALNQFNSTNPFMQGSNKQEEYFNVIRKALEKQIPKKPLHWDDCEQFYIECPCCGRRYDSRLGYKGCPYCLQAIRLE